MGKTRTPESGLPKKSTKVKVNTAATYKNTGSGLKQTKGAGTTKLKTVSQKTYKKAAKKGTNY
jgi:hypothetical protein